MKSAIEEIRNGSLSGKSPNLGKEYKKAVAATAEKEAAILELIKDNKETLKAFKEYQDAEEESFYLEVRGYYKHGFRHGFRIAIDALDEE
ncbi:MAG: hypothetical protein HDP28_01415 [Clostridia bacterium]|nr:hypothetical protein [Clostridia bacterium]